MSTEAQKEYARRWYHANKEKAAATMRAYYLANKEKFAAAKKAWKAANPERFKEIEKASRDRSDKARKHANNRAWREANKEHVKERERRRLQTPKYMARNAASAATRRRARCRWADADHVNALYQLARIYSDHAGQKYHVDHIVPLKHKLVCGLHNERNLQILPSVENLKKRNEFEVI